ncbi:tyrosine phosphatase-like protein [Syncephalis plumigaleata]|nr:tyrosine phosphatase-like protein [Syncephalis plumigaleata]
MSRLRCCDINSYNYECNCNKTYGLIQAYLIVYNVASCIAWGHVLQRAIVHLTTHGLVAGLPTLYADIGDELRWVQTAAALEIIHSALGFVRSPLSTTMMQVASRLLLVWGVRTHWAFTSMTVACDTLCIYALGLLNMSPDLLLWCRYTFFYVLYPVGAGSEAMLIYQSLSEASRLYPVYGIVLRVILMLYPPLLGVMYTHMISQRKRYLKNRANDQKKKQK